MTISPALREIALPLTPDLTVEGDAQGLGSTVGSPCCLCPHALAYQSLVYGRTSRRKHVDRHDSTWLGWKSSLAPNHVTQIISNPDGSILAAATESGAVSLLRGSDGRVLATRQVSKNSTRLCFVPRFRQDGGDTLLIQTPEIDDGDEMQCVVVSNIMGSKLNGMPESAAEAARQMKICAIPKNAEGWKDIVRVTALFRSESILMLLAVDDECKLRLFDWDLESGSLSLIKDQIPLKLTNDGQEWTVDIRHEFMTQPLGNHTYILFAVYSTGKASLVWFDPRSMVCVSHIPLDVSVSHVGVFLPIPSHESTLAVAVAVKAESTTLINVFQHVIEDTMGLKVLTNPHMVFSVPVDSPVHSVSLCSTLDDDTYAFVYQSSRQGLPIVEEVRPTMSSLATIGKIRYYVKSGLFDQADKLLATLDEEALDPMADFHPSEVASARLQSMVAVENPQVENIEACLQRLARSAMTLNGAAVQSFAEACEMIADQQINHRADRQLSVIELVLKFVGGIIDKVPSLDSTVVKEVENRLLDRKRALRFVAAIPDESVATKLLGLNSMEDLLAKLLTDKHYLLVEKLWDWEGGESLSVDRLLTQLVHLSAAVEPKGYLPLLKGVLFPNLTIHHELLPILQAWACDTANGMDENDVGLSSAISLLETVRDGIHDLRLQLHSSFASHSPFVDGLQPRKSRRSPGILNSSNLGISRIDTTTSKWASLGNRPSLSNRPPPTVLQLGGLKTGATKLNCRTVGRWSTSDDIDEECVEEKLIAAQCLLRAREFGLPQNSVRLREFGSSLSLEEIAVKLARTLSGKASNHDERYSLLRDQVKVFCDEINCDFDRVLLSYIGHLCKASDTSIACILESASVARACSSDEQKSQGTLTVVRACSLCGYSEESLLQQARDAIEWASSNSSLQSEMEEASRLLLIDSIISKYCGKAARELFRVDNPKHAIRLMEYVIHRVNSSNQITDILDLCDAFTHLSKRDSIVLLLRHGISKGDSEICLTVLNSLYDRDPCLADTVLVGAISFILELLSDSCCLSGESRNVSDDMKLSVTKTSDIGCELLGVALQRGRRLVSDANSEIDCFVNEGSLGELRDQFVRIHELQTRHGVFVSLSDLFIPAKQVHATVMALQPAVDAFVDDDFKGFVTGVKKAERVCMLLAGRKSAAKQDIWKVATSCVAESLVTRVDTVRFGDYLHGVGLFDGEQNGVACRGLLRLALSLCTDHCNEDYEGTSKQEAYEMSLAASLVRDHAIHLCDDSTLISVIDVDSFFDPCHVVLTMTDNGLGDKVIQFREAILALSSRNLFENRRSVDDIDVLDVHQPAMHPTWYHGDGLLLPPDQTTSMLKWFCRSTIKQTSNASQASAELQRLLSEKGSSFSRLRILNAFWSKFLVTPGLQISQDTSDVPGDFETSLLSLAERCIGGTGVGMTSGVIDSELSVAFLLSLPVKLAFKIYTSTIPTAIRTQQYHRLSTLANVGKAICTGAAGAIPIEYQPSAWTRQHKFLDQCKNLALQASWWIRFSERGIEFDPNRFETKIDKSRSGDNYTASLILSLIASYSKDFEPQVVLEIAASFAIDFGVDPAKVLESHIEFILEPLQGSSKVAQSNSYDARLDLSFCSRVAQQSARRLAPLDRTRVLRRCVKRFEHAGEVLVDYERFGCVLSLYREALTTVLDKSDMVHSIDTVPFEVELELVDRRKDALEILSAYFSGARTGDRPDFLGFFPPLARIFGDSPRVDNSTISVLGAAEGEFDPLYPLHSAMMSANNAASSQALSPLCAALGLPPGYIRARFLIARFEMSSINSTSLPSFENDVDPVLERLRSPRDKALLAEWCALRYKSQDDDRLKCYDLALNAAMLASSEIEFRRRDTPGLAELETESLETVRRITIAKGSLSDKLRVVAILNSHGSKKGSCLDLLIDNVLAALKDLDSTSPENLMDFVLRKTSSIVAEWTVDFTKSLSTSHLRQLATLVNRVCIALSEQHSHIDPQRHARLLASDWLFRGNTDNIDVTEAKEPRAVAQVQQLASIEDEADTLDFVLDLDELKQSDTAGSWALKSRDNAESCQTSEEEPSSLRQNSSREESEWNSRIASLRVAFVLASSIERGDGMDENMSPRMNNPSKSSASKKKFGLLSKVETKRDYSKSNDITRHVARQLLQVAFAKKVFKLDAFNESLHTTVAEIDGYHAKTITYAMRHRALRAAAVLCPQEILEDICVEESYLRLELEMKETTLKMCSFGVFVAKEIEEMGLQLPHSDLPQLSSMNFPSYARTLWRHNRDANHTVSKGRLLLLLSEMLLKDDVLDCDFLSLLLKEMLRIGLPRTQLGVLERISQSSHIEACKASHACGSVLWNTLESTANAIISEAFALTELEDAGEAQIKATTETFVRLGRSIISLCGIEQVPKLSFFVKVVSRLLGQTKCGQLHLCLRTVLMDIERHQNSVGYSLRSKA